MYEQIEEQSESSARDSRRFRGNVRRRAHHAKAPIPAVWELLLEAYLYSLTKR